MTQKITTELKVQSHIAVDAISERKLRPYGCIGRSPLVCKTLYKNAKVNEVNMT